MKDYFSNIGPGSYEIKRFPNAFRPATAPASLMTPNSINFITSVTKENHIHELTSKHCKAWQHNDISTKYRRLKQLPSADIQEEIDAVKALPNYF